MEVGIQSLIHLETLIIFEAANNNIKILNYPVRYYARKSGAPNISRWIDGLKLLKVCWLYMISDI